MESAFKSKEKDEKEKQRKKKRKKKKEVSFELSVKKETIQKTKSTTSSFGEVKPIIDIKFVSTQIAGAAKGVTKNEIIVKQDVAITLAKEEKRIKKMKLETQQAENIEKLVSKEQKKIERETEKVKTNKRVERKKRLKKIKKLVEITQNKIKSRSKLNRITQERSKKIHELLKEARYLGMKDPIVEVASKLVRLEIRKGTNPKFAIRKVILLLGRLKIINKGNLEGIFKALKGLFRLK